MRKPTGLAKRHFEALAEALVASKPVLQDAYQENYQPLRSAMFAQWQEDVQSVCRVCQNSNPRFDTQRFLTACGLERTS